MSFLLRLAVVAAVIAFVWWMTRPKFDFTITVSGGEVSLQGRLAQARWNEVAHFLREQPHIRGTLRICGRKLPSGRWELRFRGPLDWEQRQRIRNFLVEVL
jgi:hypothetical protein